MSRLSTLKNKQAGKVLFCLVAAAAFTTGAINSNERATSNTGVQLMSSTGGKLCPRFPFCSTNPSHEFIETSAYLEETWKLA